MKIFIHICFFYVLSLNNVYAYIDPGTGGIILQAIVAFIAAFFAYVTLFWRKFKSLLTKLFKKKKNIDIEKE